MPHPLNSGRVWLPEEEKAVYANSGSVRESRPDSGLDFHVKVLETFQVVPSLLGGGTRGGGGLEGPEQGRYKATCKRELKPPWCEAVPGDT